MINALSELEHPCQAMADMLTLQEQFGDLRGVHFAYVGDGNNMAHSLMLAAASLGASISVGTPKGYEPNRRDRCAAQELAAADRVLRYWSPTIRSRRLPAPMRSTPTCGPAWGRRRSCGAAARSSRPSR